MLLLGRARIYMKKQPPAPLSVEAALSALRENMTLQFFLGLGFPSANISTFKDFVV